MTITLSVIKPTDSNTMCKTASFIEDNTTDAVLAEKSELTIGLVKYWQCSAPEIYEVNLIGKNNQPVKFTTQITTVKRQDDGYIFVIHSTDLCNTDLVLNRALVEVGPMGDGYVFSCYERQIIYRRGSVGSVFQDGIKAEDIQANFIKQRAIHEKDIAMFCRGILGSGEVPDIKLPSIA